MKPLDVSKTNSPSERVHSDKIGLIRRALFPYSDPSEIDMDVNPLNMNSEHLECQNISNIPSTELIRKLLGTPERKCINSVDTDYCSYEPTGDNETISSLSQTEILKTPNDSNTQTENAPKLSRKSLGGAYDKEDLNSSGNKSSKVRTTLFQEFEISLSTKQFYPSANSDKTPRKTPSSIPQGKKLDRPKTRKYNPKKKLPGQINAGVRHKIKKKTTKVYKLSKSSVSLIKTYKSDIAVSSKFDKYLEDLKEISENKQIKQIQHVPERDQSDSSKKPSLKRSHDTTEEKSSKKAKRDESDCFENDLDDTIDLPIEKILDVLGESVGEDKENMSRDKEGILSPTSVLSNMTSGLKLGSPKKARNLTTIFQNMADVNSQDASDSSTAQYYPLFYPQKKPTEKVVAKECYSKKKKMKISSDQMLLDAGQKKFGLVECGECSFVYNAGDPKDEYLHENHHNAINILQFNGWKNERIVENLDGRIIQILPGDSKHWVDKVKQVAEFINRELGYHELEDDLSRSMVFFYIFNKSIIGCVMAEGKAAANKILTANIDVDLCSSEEYPIVCGVSRLWIASNFRKRGIATKLMDTLRKHFLPNRMIGKHEMALSAPTPDGKMFATKYFETPNFYTYLN